MTPRIGIVVLGMHRSGTSAITRTLGLLGATLPVHMIGPGIGNQAGHWEPAPLVAIHERMLVEAGSGWDDWRAFDPRALPGERLRAYRDEIVSCLIEEYGESPLFVVKDPRMARFVPLYANLLASVGVEPRYVICLRNPLAVIDSLAVRNGTSPGFAALFWLRHVLEAEAATRASTRCLISYERLMDDWRDTVTLVAASLGIDWQVDLDNVGPTIDTFLSGELQHHRPKLEDLGDRPEAAGWVKSAYEALESLRLDPSGSSAIGTLDGIKSEFDRFAELFGAATFPELYARDRRIHELTAERLREMARANEAERALVTLQHSRSWRLTQPLREARRLVARRRAPTQ